MRLSALGVLLISFTLSAGRVTAHAGHDHAPEAPVETVGDVAPRFYAQSDNLEAVLLFPSGDRKEEPQIYLLSKETNQALDGAQVSVEVLSGSDGKVTVTPSPVPGAYKLDGLDDAKSTLSLMLEVSKGDLLEILSVDNVLPPEPETATTPLQEAVTGSALLTGGTVFGLPRYLVLGLLAMNALVAVVIVLAALIWLFGKLRRRKSGRRPPAVGQHAGAATVLLLAGGALLLPQGAFAHAGEDHSGASLAASATLTSGTRHFVPIQTQIEADILTTRVQERVLPRSFKALGRVEVRSDYKAVVTPPVEGRLLATPRSNGETTRVPVIGEKVNKGDILVVVEQILPAAEKVTLTTERAQVESELLQAEQQLALAAQNRERAERLAKVISAKELEEARAQQKIAQDKVTGLRSRLQTLASALSGSGASVREVTVVAPISGMITEAHATVGEYVNRDKSLFTIINLDEVFVGADVFESDLQALQGARTARVTLEAFPDEAFEGTLHAVSQEIDPESRAVHVLFNVKNPEHKLRGGAFANVLIQSDDQRAVVVVPKSAVLAQDGVRHVLRKVTPEVFAADPVIVSEFREDVAVIEAGLKKDDRIAVTGLYQIRMSPTLGRETK